MSPLTLIAKRSIKSFAASCGGNRFLNWNRAQTKNVFILAYHRVVADLTQAERDTYHGLVISADSFEQHLRIVQKHYQVVSIDDAVAIVRGEKPLQQPTAVITFDDGYEDNYDVAWPILKKLGLPATIYIPTNYIGKDQPLDHDKIQWLISNAFRNEIALDELFSNEDIPQTIDFSSPIHIQHLIESLVYLPIIKRQSIIKLLESSLGISSYPLGYNLMNWDMVRKMSQSGISFGSHTANHPVLTNEDNSTVETEINQSLQTIKTNLPQRAVHFAYPNGCVDERVRKIVAAAGITSAVTTQRNVVKIGDDCFTMGRYSFCEESMRGISGKFNGQIAKLRLGV